MKIKFNSDDHLSVKEALEVHNIVIVVRGVFHEGNNYYTQVFIDECLYEL